MDSSLPGFGFDYTRARTHGHAHTHNTARWNACIIRKWPLGGTAPPNYWQLGTPVAFGVEDDARLRNLRLESTLANKVLYVGSTWRLRLRVIWKRGRGWRKKKSLAGCFCGHSRPPELVWGPEAPRARPSEVSRCLGRDCFVDWRLLVRVS